ncbi:MAG: pseudouridine synthase [Gammaproteobacteria bacterium]|nr:pseudouridine synthase [Gammaproteobacteria bacterium]
MTLINYFSANLQGMELPAFLPSPFDNQPHPLAIEASQQLQKLLGGQNDWQHDFEAIDGGKMFGVLIVQDAQQRLGYLSAFSGMLAGQWDLPGFVPPLFSQEERDSFLPKGEDELAILSDKIRLLQNSSDIQELQQQLQALNQQFNKEIEYLKRDHKNRKQLRRQLRETLDNIESDAGKKLLQQLSFESQQDRRELKSLRQNWLQRIEGIEKELKKAGSQIDVLKKTRLDLSKELHNRVFDGYILINALGEHKPMTHFFSDKLPPGGTGDCAAPKLFQYANQKKLKPIALAEFWWGASPSASVRHHGHYYPSCRGKCHPILPFMLQGLAVQQEKIPGYCITNDVSELTIVYEDDDLLVVNKPNRLLSVPGKEISDSVLSQLQQRYPAATGPLLVHRLDYDTSGLLLAAKNSAVHKALQKQFMDRTVKKRYVALLSKITLSNNEMLIEGKEGVIELPIRVDLDDRPRQLVCSTYGKYAKTHWRVIGVGSETIRVHFYPITGRTHQLRVHAAHVKGLNTPIIGDKLYGQAADRLYLHAEYLCFIHPKTGKKMEMEAPAAF